MTTETPHQLQLGVLDIADISRKPDVSISSSAAVTSAYTQGIYDIWSDIDCFIKVAVDATGVTTDNGYEIFAGKQYILFVPTGYEIGVISSASSGTLKIHKSRNY